MSIKMSIIVERITMEMMFIFKFYKWNVFFKLN